MFSSSLWLSLFFLDYLFYFVALLCEFACPGSVMYSVFTQYSLLGGGGVNAYMCLR